ncbi:MAG: hypothetical protein WC709_06900 [Thermoleophilia bacterium]
MPGPSTIPTRPQSWSWFLLWAALGAAATFGTLSLQLLVAPLVLLVVAVLVARGAVSRAAFGLLTGAGLVCLVVAWVQRRGPGVVSWRTATASGADEYLDPRPWLVAGAVLAAAGIGAFAWRRRSSAQPRGRPDDG